MVKDDALAGRNGFDFFVEIDCVVFENGGEKWSAMAQAHEDFAVFREVGLVTNEDVLEGDFLRPETCGVEIFRNINDVFL